MNYTTVEQSKKLLELGLNSETADMKWYYWKDEIDAPKVPTLKFDKKASESYKNEIVYLPCWSLGALLGLIPNYQLHTQDKGVGILFGCRKELKIIEASTPIEAVYNMVCWLLENGYIKKGE